MDSPPKLRIGELLVKEHLIAHEQLKRALAVAEKTRAGKPLGEICVDLNFISRPDLKRFLKKHYKRINLGDLLVNLGLLNQEQLEEALEEQKTGGGKIGQILINKGFVTELSLINALSMQLEVPKIIPDLTLIDTSLLEQVNLTFLRKIEALPAFKKDDGLLTVIMSDPLNEETVSILKKFFKCNIQPAIALSKDILRTIDAFQRVGELGQEKSPKEGISDLIISNKDLSLEREDKVIGILNYIVNSAVQENASDIHIEPLEDTLRIRFRIDGVLHHKTDLPLFLGPNLISRIKILCKLDISDKRRPQDGRIKARIYGREVNLRVSTYPSFLGENLVIRILDPQITLIEIERLGFSSVNIDEFKKILEYPSGIILVTGPTGTGKTTTLYASLNYLNISNRMIITIEDPIESTMPGVVQGQIESKLGLTYMDYLKSMMRQDPDVLMLGEIRDGKAANAVIQCALTGHKVLTTFHTDDATGALLRLMDMGIETFLISSTVTGVLAQRLVRILCVHCREPYVPEQKLFAHFNIKSIRLDKHNFYKAQGCPECNNTGYKDRTAIHELLIINNAIRDAILSHKHSSELRLIAIQEADLTSLRDDGFYKASRGITTLEEVLRVTPYNDSDQFISRTAEDIVARCERGKKASV